MAIEWNKGFSVGVDKFDDHHKKLFSLVNDMFVCCKEKDNDRLVNVAKEMNDYTTFHLSAEEQAMRVNDYPGLSDHLLQHTKFRELASGLAKDAGKLDTTQLLQQIMGFVDWLGEHIGRIDRAYGKYFKEHGIVIT